MKATIRPCAEIDGKELTIALKGATEEIKSKIFGNMSKRAAEGIAEDMDYMLGVAFRRQGRLDERGQFATLRVGTGEAGSSVEMPEAKPEKQAKPRRAARTARGDRESAGPAKAKKPRPEPEPKAEAKAGGGAKADGGLSSDGNASATAGVSASADAGVER